LQKEKIKDLNQYQEARNDWATDKSVEAKARMAKWQQLESI